MAVCSGGRSLKRALVIVHMVVAALFMSQAAVAKSVIAKGVSEVDNNKVVEARKVALENAKRAAVEQVVGTFIRARTDVTNFILTKDQIYSNTAGQISNYTIETDGVNADGIYEVVINADVKVNDLLNSAIELQTAYGGIKKPRITVLADQNSSDYAVAQQAKNRLSQQLLNDGFDVFSEQEPVYAGFVLDVLTQSSSQADEFQGIALKSNELTVNMSVRRVGDNQVLASTVESATKPGVNSNKIFSDLTQSIIRKSWPGLRNQMMQFWQKEQLQARNIFLDIAGVTSLKQAKQLISVLSEAMPAVQQIEISAVDGGTAKLVVTYKGWTEQLYEELVASEAATRQSMKVTGVKGNKITATIA